jgi:uncharacterized membrane protein
MGLSAAYFFDPISGNRRRARLGDTIDHARRAGRRELTGALNDLEHRAHGMVSRARTAATEREVDDDTLVARVRSRLGRVSTSIRDIGVTCRGGVVELTGAVMEDEIRTVLHTARSTHGVRDVVDGLERRKRDVARSGLAGTVAIMGRRPGHWSRAKRLAVGTTGAASTLWGLERGGIVGSVLVSLGAAALVRSATDRSIGELTGMTRPTRGIDLQKTINIHAPAEDVYRVLTDFESYPRFTRHVQSVERTDDNRWRVVLTGLGRKLELDGVLLEKIPNQFLSWTSAENSPLELTGSMRLERIAADATRLTVRLSYRPTAALLRHEIAAMFHADAKHELDQDVLRLQSLLEQGKATGRDGQISLEELLR